MTPDRDEFHSRRFAQNSSLADVMQTDSYVQAHVEDYLEGRAATMEEALKACVLAMAHRHQVLLKRLGS